MQNEELPWDDDTEIDCELWLQVLLAMTSTKEGKEKLVNDISQKTGLAPEQTELILSHTIQFMVAKVRSN